MLSNQNEIKEQLLRDFHPLKDDKKYLDLQIFDHIIRIYIVSDIHHEENIINKMYVFLKNYMSYFPTTREYSYEKDYSVYYHVAPVKYSSDNHVIWNDASYEFHKSISDENPNLVNIIQRDFIGKIHKESHDIHAMGPIFSRENTDPIDNLMMSVMMRVLSPKNAIALHCATVEVEDECYVFFGQSGAGKSTLAMQSFDLDQYRVLGGDQVYLQIKDESIIASPCTTTIYGIPRDHQAWCSTPRKVKGLFYLIQREGESRITKMNDEEFIKLFLKETIQWPEFTNSIELLETVSKICGHEGLSKGQFSYKKGESFWASLLNQTKV